LEQEDRRVGLQVDPDGPEPDLDHARNVAPEALAPPVGALALASGAGRRWCGSAAQVVVERPAQDGGA
jgi:hypothetical protein